MTVYVSVRKFNIIVTWRNGVEGFFVKLDRR